MTRIEMAQILAYIAMAVSKPLSEEASEVYFDVLGHLSADVMKKTARIVVAEHKWATFPTVGELCQVAAEVARGEVKELSSAEAWEIAWKAIGKIDPEQEGSVERGCRNLPPLVVRAMEGFGICALCFGKEPITVVRSQFIGIFEQLQAKERRLAMLPPGMQKAIEGNGRALLPPVLAITDKIGREQ